MSRYIALEGVDGSGKSTVAELLQSRLREQGDEVIVVREPGGTDVGEAVRGLLLDSDSLGVWAEVFLFAAQRAELVGTVVGPALERGATVISDRTYYSSIAYQGAGRGLGMETIRELNEMGLGGVTPHRVYVLDVAPDVALSRQENPDRIGSEGLRFQELVRSGYLELAETDPKVVVLDGSASVSDLVSEIMDQSDG